MPSDSQSSTSRIEALHEARRRLTLLEIETHRIKAELARLEAEEEEDLADRLEDQLEEGIYGDIPSNIRARSWGYTSRFTSSDFPRFRSDSFDPLSRASEESSLLPTIDLVKNRTGPSPDQDAAKTSLKRMPTWVVAGSIAFHMALLFLFGWASFAVTHQEKVPLMASAADAIEETWDEISEVEIEPAEWETLEWEEVSVEGSLLEFDESFLSDLAPLESNAVASVLEENSLLSHPGMMMLGNGTGEEEGLSGRKGRGKGVQNVSFFGRKSQGQRFVFIVDNSPSMKKGRLQTALFEIVHTVESMSPRQAFFVLFVSNKTYPMFAPVTAPDLLPATAENKQRLREWLGTVELFGGKGTVLMDAFQQAATLRPDVVYFLWDGAFGGPATERKVMTYLTKTPWPFTVYTLGMGVPNAHAAIAFAHRGEYRSVAVTAEAAAMAKRNPIKQNK